MRLKSLTRKKGLFERLAAKNKKGMGIGDIYPVMLTIALVAILIAVVLLVMVKFQRQSATDAYSVSNESGSLDYSAYTLATRASSCDWNTPIITEVWNFTTNPHTQIELADANWTFTEATGALFSSAGGFTNDNFTQVNVSYSYKAGGESCRAMGSIVDDISHFVPWIGIILLIVAASIVIGILIKNLAGGSRV